ncbi:hypothetical protein O3P69_020655 [Scylla paramamosain]|uniref:Uncharacterized protein n=1 Tax=Scylla paramamosain TaxID=85552 RepID=A0AAW0TNN5_SCYPA
MQESTNQQCYEAAARHRVAWTAAVDREHGDIHPWLPSSFLEGHHRNLAHPAQPLVIHNVSGRRHCTTYSLHRSHVTT